MTVLLAFLLAFLLGMCVGAFTGAFLYALLFVSFGKEHDYINQEWVDRNARPDAAGH